MRDQRHEALIQEILSVLDLDHQYTCLVEAWSQDRIPQSHHCGRTSDKRLGVKIRTFATHPERDDGRIAVWVVVTAAYPADEEGIRERGDLLYATPRTRPTKATRRVIDLISGQPYHRPRL